MEEGDAEAVPDVEDESGDAGDQEEGEEGSPEEAEQIAVPVKARIICSGVEEPMTIGKSLVPGGSPLHMEVPGAGTIVLTATLKPPEPPADEVKCLCPTSAKRSGSTNEQLKAISTTMEQISSMQQVLSDLKDKAQAMSDQLLGGGRGPAPAPALTPMGGPPALPYGGMPMQQPMAPPGFGGVPPGGREVFSAGGVGIYVVQKDASPMGGGMPYDYLPPPPPMQALPPPDFGQRDWGSPMAVTQSRGGDPYQSGGGGNVCCGGGGQMMTCGGMSGCGGGRVTCCGGGVRISCCGGGMPVSCCGAQMNPCGGGGGGGGGPQQQQQQQQVGGYPRMSDAEQQLALCQGDCTMPCDSAGTPCVGRTR